MRAETQARRDAPSSNPLDDEVVLPDHAIQTVREYCHLLKAMQRGGDVMLLLESHGMTVEQWTACAGAWSALFMRRMELAMRFSVLLQEP
ncbi:MAG: hypothetical protein JST92_14115 [Deltaproteobacteria bacterium]|nr:hypothetical protein [Deltaproteobacteria bacterium]